MCKAVNNAIGRLGTAPLGRLEMPVSTEDQLARLRGAPPLVLWLVSDAGCWVTGSRASFSDCRLHAASDWDILVPWKLWETVVGALPLDKVVPTRKGGWRVRIEGQHDIDVFPGDIGDWLVKPFTHVAWHPKTGTVIEKR